MNENQISVDGVLISTEYAQNETVIKSIIPNRKNLPYYKYLKRYLHNELLQEYPELESEFARRIKLLGQEDQILTDAFLHIVEFSKEMLQHSDISIQDLPELELKRGFEYIKEQFII
ncbi:hypothetical protein C1631_022950 [Chryseobacterium phosphatilyticum]|uniref:Uncharacterized protein n=1 Tax=Chryseobacterium phosphatilyticum TaxID=475075 RepID=A0A316WPK6_9FLAO|nr:hypothetical protein [Chryseobacterium phosphatilyticum]PWN62426.1 hypothetical protein C1631_022950 [Chryseobacterium phosphatilyticum]